MSFQELREVITVCEELEKTPHRVVGMKQVLRALNAEKALKVYLALDADEEMKNQVCFLAHCKGVPVQKVGTMKSLSKMCSVSVPASCAALVGDTKLS